MNKQEVRKNGVVVSRGIEWCHFTHNPPRGCKHECGWEMPDGKIAMCYAKGVAEGLARHAYPNGFSYHYWNPDILDEPLRVKEPARIFWGSMADIFGSWVPDEQIQACLDVCRRAYWHTHIFLTKNPPRLRRFNFPPNVWAGVSMPPTFMMGKRLTPMQQDKWFFTAVHALSKCNARVKWVSFEPLSYDIFGREMCGEHWEHLTPTINWAVIGAASNGKTYYQPDPQWVADLIETLDFYGNDGQDAMPIFFKGNLKGNVAADPWREEFPVE